MTCCKRLTRNANAPLTPALLCICVILCSCHFAFEKLRRGGVFCVVWAGDARAGTALLSRIARAGRCRACVCGRFEPAYFILFMATSYAAAVAFAILPTLSASPTTKRSFTLPSSSLASPLTGRAPRERTTASASTRDCSLVFTFSTSAPFASMATSLVDSRNFAPAFSSLGIASSRCWNHVPGGEVRPSRALSCPCR